MSGDVKLTKKVDPTARAVASASRDVELAVRFLTAAALQLSHAGIVGPARAIEAAAFDAANAISHAATEAGLAALTKAQALKSEEI